MKGDKSVPPKTENPEVAQLRNLVQFFSSALYNLFLNTDICENEINKRVFTNLFQRIHKKYIW
jgi:hypothetical protein